MSKRTCWNGCKLFQYDFDHGMKAFSVAEFFIAFYNFRTSLVLGQICHNVLQQNANEEGMPFEKILHGISLIAFWISIFIQTVMGWLLFFYGWKHRNVTVCWIWFVAALMNFFYPTFIYLSFYQNLGPGFSIPIFCEIYFIYTPYGCWIIYNFVKWAESRGIATEIRVNVSEEPEDEVDLEHNKPNKGDKKKDRPSEHLAPPPNSKQDVNPQSDGMDQDKQERPVAKKSKAGAKVHPGAAKETEPGKHKKGKMPKMAENEKKESIDFQKTDDYF